MQDLLFTRSRAQIERKLSMISQLVNAGKFSKIADDTELIEYICKETIDVKKLQDLLSKVHQKDFDAANKSLQLIIFSMEDDQADENIQTGLITLQKSSKNAIDDQNVAYLALLIIAYKNVGEQTIQESLCKVFEFQTQNLVERVI